MRANQPATQNEEPFHKGSQAVSRTDLKGGITNANNAFVDIGGFSREQLIGVNHNIGRHPDMLAQAFAWRWETMKEGRPWRGVVKSRAKNDNFHCANAFARPVRKNSETISFSYMSTREPAAAVDTFHEALNANKAPILGPSALAKRPLRTQLTGLLIGLLATHVVVAVLGSFGSGLGLATGDVGFVVHLFDLLGVLVGLWLVLMQNQFLPIGNQIIACLGNIGKLNDALATMQTHPKATDLVGENADSAPRAAQAVVSSHGLLNSETRRMNESALCLQALVAYFRLIR
jgi:PAS domain S-box-containing protein